MCVAALLLLHGPSLALGLGVGDSGATLGQPLNFAVQVRLEAGDTLSPECTSAEVSIGERRVPAALVRVSAEMTSPQTARLRVQTAQTVDEPVVAVQLAVGCSNRVSRSYVVLADPPMLAEARPAAPALPATALPPPALTEPAPAAQAGAPVPPPRRVAPAPAPELTPAQIAAREERRARLRAERQARQQAARQAREARAAQAAAPRLQMDILDASPRPAAESAAVAEALAAVAQAASAARQAASAASASAARVAALEAELGQMRREAEESRELTTQLRQRLAEAEGAGRWTTPLVASAVLLALLAAWLAWRLGRVQAAQRALWQGATAAAGTGAEAGTGPLTSATAMGLDAPSTREPTSPVPFVAGAAATARGPVPSAAHEMREARRAEPTAVPPTVSLGAPAAKARASRAWPPPAPPVAWPRTASTLPPDLPGDTLPGLSPDSAPEPPMQRTEALPAGGRGSESLPRDVSIEELIDLEQQAEFFMVLGQDEAAVDLLVEHLRSTGGGSPLPYLKLLEIHRRRGDHEAYERMRQRFNHRFNAYAPEWGVDLTSGRSLEDYAGVIPRLQQVWPRPLDAMAELEALLFRKSRGELFDLPAYREVLFLYALARDLLDRAAVDTGSVDLLLPMGDGSADGITSPAPLEAAGARGGLERDAFKDTMPPEDPRTVPLVDFDLTGGDRPTSIFDLLEDPPRTRPPRL
jgi:pilus assembly protein FimV